MKRAKTFHEQRYREWEQDLFDDAVTRWKQVCYWLSGGDPFKFEKLYNESDRMHLARLYTVDIVGNI